MDYKVQVLGIHFKYKDTIFTVFKIKKCILKAIVRGKIYIMFFYKNIFLKKSFAQVHPVNGIIYFLN